MHIRVGCEFRYEATWPTPTIMQVQPYPDETQQILHEQWQAVPDLSVHLYHDIYGNICQRFTLPMGENVLRYNALVAVSGEYDSIKTDAEEVPVETLPDETLLYTLPSRYCLSDVLSDAAWQLFGHVQPGWTRVQAISDWVHNNIHFQYGTSKPTTTAVDVFEKRVGVCRDFTQLAVTFCRALNIPARYVFGYLPDIGVPPPDEPMDFCAWMEVYLSGQWWTFDPRNNIRRVGRVLIGRGRDALDVAMVTTYGGPQLQQMTVWAEEASSASHNGL
ncbi:MAG: transglutaminase family protein [Chloroflexi bacterium]|nr:MAG: transglutaminase family protein [Chloroflexota bacterium]